MFKSGRFTLLVVVLALFIGALPIAAQDAETLVIYSGRSEGLIGPILEQFTADTGIQVEVRYGSTPEMAATILEEGENSPADVYISQDAGALGALSQAGLLRVLSPDVQEKVSSALVATDGTWISLSARARVLVYNTDLLTPEELPTSILDVASPEWASRLGWAPTNASLQAQVTALRLLSGEEATQAWLEGLVANGATTFGGNGAVVQAVIDGEIEVGLVNHYYLFGFLADNPDVPAANYYFPAGDPGALINIAGAGVLSTSDQPGLAERLILYLLGTNAQQYFADSTYEYPVVEGIATNELLVPLSEIEAPDLDLSALSDLQASIDLITASGALP